MPIQSCGQSVSAQRGKRYTDIGQFDDCRTLTGGEYMQYVFNPQAINRWGGAE
jgi:hypothetical protein